MVDKTAERSLLILGMGQYGFVAQEIAQAMQIFDKIAFLDDNNPDAIGKMSEMERYAGEYGCAVVAIGDPQLRQTYLKTVKDRFALVSLVHPQSCVSPSAVIAEGCIIEPMAVVHTQAQLGMGCLIGAGAVVNHNSRLGPCCHIDCNATVSARADVAAYTKLASGHVYNNQD